MEKKMKFDTRVVRAEIEPDPTRRAAFIAEHVGLWRITWLLERPVI